MKKIDNIRDFAELFMAILSMDKDKYDEVYFSRNFKFAVDAVLSNPKYKSILDSSFYNELGEFKLNDFISEINTTKLKKYVTDDFMYDMLTNEVILLVKPEKTLKILEQYDYSDIVKITSIVSDVVRLDENLYEKQLEKKQACDGMNNFSRKFLSSYIMYNRYDESKLIVLPKNFPKYVEYVMNNICCKYEFMSIFDGIYVGEDEKFDIDSFTQSIEYSKLKIDWAEAWEIDLQTDQISAKMNNELVEYVYNAMDEEEKELIDDVVFECDELIDETKKLLHR